MEGIRYVSYIDYDLEILAGKGRLSPSWSNRRRSEAVSGQLIAWTVHHYES